MSLKDFEIIAFQKKENGPWFARLNQKKFTPSGCDRLLPLVSSNMPRENKIDAVLDIVDLVMVKPTYEPLTLANTAVHREFIADIEAYLENPDKNRFNKKV